MRTYGNPEMRGAALFGMGLTAVALLATPVKAATLAGAPTKIGGGTAQVIVETDSAGAPTSIAISMTEGAVSGVPTELNKNSPEGGYEYALAMPDGVNTGYGKIMVDWNPQGHPPEHVYTVPHFDFHFYAIAPEEVERIMFTGPDDPAIQVSDKDLLAPDYQVIPDTAVPMMGVHAIDMTAPELHGEPFTETFIYGYDKGKLIFLEPMVTQAFLQSRPDVTMPVKTPAKYSEPGFYPASYTVRFDAAADRYMIQLGGLKAWK